MLDTHGQYQRSTESGNHDLRTNTRRGFNENFFYYSGYRIRERVCWECPMYNSSNSLNRDSRSRKRILSCRCTRTTAQGRMFAKEAIKKKVGVLVTGSIVWNARAILLKPTISRDHFCARFLSRFTTHPSYLFSAPFPLYFSC